MWVLERVGRGRREEGLGPPPQGRQAGSRPGRAEEPVSEGRAPEGRNDRNKDSSPSWRLGVPSDVQAEVPPTQHLRARGDSATCRPWQGPSSEVCWDLLAGFGRPWVGPVLCSGG